MTPARCWQGSSGWNRGRPCNASNAPSSPPTARNLTQVYVSRLRQTLRCRRTATVPGQVLVTRPPGYLLRVEAGELDVHRFEALAAAARRASAAGDLAGAAERWRAALALWRGPALDGVASEALRRLQYSW